MIPLNPIDKRPPASTVLNHASPTSKPRVNWQTLLRQLRINLLPAEILDQAARPSTMAAVQSLLALRPNSFVPDAHSKMSDHSMKRNKQTEDRLPATEILIPATPTTLTIPVTASLHVEIMMTVDEVTVDNLPEVAVPAEAETLQPRQRLSP